jgi:sugar phosphate isomerase/epimerase
LKQTAMRETSQIKNRRFKLATTSFIVPDHIVPNVEKLGPYFDEIELLVFESQPHDVIPSQQQVKQLLELSREHDLSYNVHLPVDIDLASPDPRQRQKACDTLMVVFERFEKLDISTHTLHLSMPKEIRATDFPKEGVKQWQQDAAAGVGLLADQGVDLGRISIETLDYPFACVEPVIAQWHLNICADLGHMIKYGEGIPVLFSEHRSKIVLIHLHGVDFCTPLKKDHQPLDLLPVEYMDMVKGLLCDYFGVVSIEVFNLDYLMRSVSVLSGWFAPIPEIFIK